MGKEGAGEGRGLCCAVALRLVELDQFAPLSQEEKGKLHAGVLSSSAGSTQWQPSGVLGKKLRRILPPPTAALDLIDTFRWSLHCLGSLREIGNVLIS